jgi:putative phosphoesterase
MKIAILSDIHGNHFALEKVLEKARREKIDQLIILGDFVGYYYHPELVLNLLNNWNFQAIRGNHENILNGLMNGEIDKQTILKKYGHGHEYALNKLTKSQIEFLIKLPTTLAVKIDDCRFKLCHGSPLDPEEYIYPDSHIDSLNMCNVPNVDFAFIGHSHYQFIHRNQDSLLINVGSVGQSRLTGGLAQWAIVDTQSKSVQLMSTPYETRQLIKQSTQIDFDIPYLREVLIRI